MRGDPLPTAEQIRVCGEMFPDPPPDMSLLEALECVHAMEAIAAKMQKWADMMEYPPREREDG